MYSNLFKLENLSVPKLILAVHVHMVQLTCYVSKVLNFGEVKAKKKTCKHCGYAPVHIIFDYMNNQNYNKILECDWLSVALIIAFIGQFTRHAWCYWTVYASFARALI